MNKDVTALIGREFEPYRLTVERGKIREFAQAIGDDNPLYLDAEAARAAGLADVTIPPTYATVIDMWGGPDFFRLAELLEMNPLQILHGEQSYEYLGTVYPGDELTARTKVADARVKSGSSGGMKLVKLETVYERDGEPVLIARSVVIERLGREERV
jgi:acyl dehydratase